MMGKFCYSTVCAMLFIVSILFQSCYVKRSANMSFVDHMTIGRDAEVVSVKVPMLLVRPFVKKELKKEDGEEMFAAIKKIKGVKLTVLSNAENNDAIRKDFKKFLKHERMEEFAAIISNGDHISINGQMKKEKVSKLMLGISSESGEHVFVEVTGSFTLDDVAQAINSYEKKNNK